MAWHTDAASGATTGRLARIEIESSTAIMADALTFPFPEMSSAWGSPDLGDAFRTPFESNTPILFVSGALDARTPPSNVEEIIGGFQNGAHLVVDGMAHDAVFDVDEVGDEALRFLAGQEPTVERASAPFAFEPP
jgi:pimeloyl-ACP methyl ester carboxylesterase